MKLIKSLAYLVLAACLLAIAGQADDLASGQSVYKAPVASESARQMLVSLVEEARDYLLENEREEALRAFSDPDGEFVRGDMYIFAYDFNGTLLAHPYLHNLIGRNNLDLTDINGIHTINNLMEVARTGEGFVYVVYPNPVEENRTRLKLDYVLKVDNRTWIGSGTYLPGEPPFFSYQDQNRLRGFVEEAKNYALQNGRDAAISVFNDPDGRFVRGDLYIFAYDFLGNALCLPFQPDLIGTNRLDGKDANGVAFTKDNLELARGGSGQTYYIYPNPKEGMRDELKLSYTTKVDDTWWLAAGIYSTSSSSNISAAKPESRDDLKTFVESAYSHILVTGKEKAIEDFMDLNGTWIRGTSTSSPRISTGPLCACHICQERSAQTAWTFRTTRVFTSTGRCERSH